MNLKHSVLTLLLAAGLGSTAQAQAPQPQFGIKGGVAAATYAGNHVSGRRPVWGGLGGVTLNVPLNRNATYSVQPELLYAQQGYKQTDGNRVALVQRLHYLQLPVLARANFGGFIVEAGPQAGLLLAANGYQNLAEGGKTRFSGTEGYRRLDAGYAAGVGYQGGSGIGAGVRYNGGLTRVAPGSNARNSVLQLYASYTLVSR